MQLCQSSTKSIENSKTTTSMIDNRRSSLAISALLNEVSIDPMQHPLAPNTTKTTTAAHLPWNNDIKFTLPTCLPAPQTYYSPISSGSSSPNGSLDSFSRRSSITEPPDLWCHSRTGMHQTNNGIIVSSLAKAKRKRILPHQYKRLVETFEKTDTPSSEIRGQLADELDMTKREVQVWFQNRRAKMCRSRVNLLSTSSQQQQSVRHHSVTLSSNSSISSINDTPRRRASEYSHPCTKQIAPRNSFLIEPNYNSNSNPNNNYNNNTTNTNQQHVSTMVLEAPYHPPQSPAIKSAIDILASAAEMMRP